MTPKPAGRYDAAPDAALEFPALELNKPFDFDGNLARRILRREVNVKEAFTVRDAKGTFYRASTKALSASGGTAVPYERLDVSPEPTIEIELVCAVLARQRMIFVVQKATELGVSRIVPLLTQHSVPPDGLEHEKAHAWPGQILRAAKQCRRSSLPELTPPTPFDAFLKWPKPELSVCLDNIPQGSSSRSREEAGRSAGRIQLIVGPEGGFSDAERKALEGRTQPWVLGGRVLRAETAVLVGLAAVQLKWGDFRG